ncbi:hypothetical protein, partial [Bradyrhizobium sp. 2TAF24]|uniref:hypothetical protein n=1 Tax=Bradyrhizobium sp. 2TAF24 TaxID=3233011 RepID=UPI003F9153C9
QSGVSYTPSFSGAGGRVVVEKGALLTTNPPTSVTAGGGFVALLGTEVNNAGTIQTPKGQALLAAGDSFALRPGYSTSANQWSTTRGNELRRCSRPAAPAGASPTVASSWRSRATSRSRAAR